jgi:hypothetical protein
MSLIFGYFKGKMKVFGGFFREIVRVLVIWSREVVFVSAKVVKIAILTRHGKYNTNSDRKNGS